MDSPNVFPIGLRAYEALLKRIEKRVEQIDCVDEKIDLMRQELKSLNAMVSYLVTALAEEQEEVDQPSTSLDGHPAGKERDSNQPL